MMNHHILVPPIGTDRLRAFLYGKTGWLMLLAGSFLLNRTVRNENDDYVFAAAFAQFGGPAGWLTYYGSHWSGRLLPHFLLICLLQLPNLVFVILNSLMLVLLIYAVNRLLPFSLNQGRWTPLLSGFLLLALLPAGPMKEAFFWKSAAVLYLWGTVGVLFALYPLWAEGEGKTPGRRDYILAFIGALYGGSFEQAACFMTGFAVLILLYNRSCRRRCSSCSLVLTAFLTAVSLIFVLMPGNAARRDAEVLAWISSFDMYSLPEKALWGVTFALNTVNGSLAAAAAFLSTVLFAAVYSRRKGSIRWLSLLVMVYYDLALTVVWRQEKTLSASSAGAFLTRAFTLISVDSSEFLFSKSTVLATAAAFCAFALLGLLLFFLREDTGEPAAPLFLYGGWGTAALMALSPTIYASGERVKFLLTLFFLLALFRALLLIAEQRESRQAAALYSGLMTACRAGNGPRQR